MELSKLPFTLKPQNTVSDLSVTRYFFFARVAPVDQAIAELDTHVEAVITLAPIEGAWPFDQWCALAHASGMLATFARNLCRHEKGIVNHCRYPSHTGRLRASTTRSRSSSGKRTDPR